MLSEAKHPSALSFVILNEVKHPSDYACHHGFFVRPWRTQNDVRLLCHAERSEASV
jgi:hypothetical protein